MKTIHLLSGLPGSGKTYYLDNFIGEDEKHRILHRDDVRAQLREKLHSEEYFPVSSDEEYEAWMLACVSVIIAHPDAEHYYFDQTTLGNGSAAKFYDELAIALFNAGIDITDYMFCIDVMGTDLETCIARNDEREGFARIPDRIIRTMASATPVNHLLRSQIHVVSLKNKYQYMEIYDIINDERRRI